MIRRIATLVALPLLLMVVVLAVFLPSERHADTVVLPTPSATPTLPACVTEDGAGQALCWWDAQAQGNGMGTSVVSGDCAPSVMGEASDACVNLHARESREEVHADGSINSIPNGADLIGECAEEWDGIELQNCIEEWLKN